MLNVFNYGYSRFTPNANTVRFGNDSEDKPPSLRKALSLAHSRQTYNGHAIHEYGIRGNRPLPLSSSPHDFRVSESEPDTLVGTFIKPNVYTQVQTGDYCIFRFVTQPANERLAVLAQWTECTPAPGNQIQGRLRLLEQVPYQRTMSFATDLNLPNDSFYGTPLVYHWTQARNQGFYLTTPPA